MEGRLAQWLAQNRHSRSFSTECWGGEPRRIWSWIKTQSISVLPAPASWLITTSSLAPPAPWSPLLPDYTLLLDCTAQWLHIASWSHSAPHYTWLPNDDLFVRYLTSHPHSAFCLHIHFPMTTSISNDYSTIQGVVTLYRSLAKYPATKMHSIPCQHSITWIHPALSLSLSPYLHSAAWLPLLPGNTELGDSTVPCDGAQLPAILVSPPVSCSLTALCSLLTPYLLRALCFLTAFCSLAALLSVTTFCHLTIPCSWSTPAPWWHTVPWLYSTTWLPPALWLHPAPWLPILADCTHALLHDCTQLSEHILSLTIVSFYSLITLHPLTLLCSLILPQSLTTPCAMNTFCSPTILCSAVSFAHSVPSLCQKHPDCLLSFCLGLCCWHTTWLSKLSFYNTYNPCLILVLSSLVVGR